MFTTTALLLSLPAHALSCMSVQVGATLDRNGLRPMRFVVTGDGMLIAGSEAGMVPQDEANVVRKGALGPGQLLAVDIEEGKMFGDTEIKDKLAASRPFGEWVGKINELDKALGDVEAVPLAQCSGEVFDTQALRPFFDARDRG